MLTQGLQVKTCAILDEMTVPAPDAAGASVPRSPDLMSSFTISTLSSFPLHLLLLGLIFLADILILFTNRQSILHHPVLCDSSHTMRYI